MSSRRYLASLKLKSEKVELRRLGEPNSVLDCRNRRADGGGTASLIDGHRTTKRLEPGRCPGRGERRRACGACLLGPALLAALFLPVGSDGGSRSRWRIGHVDNCKARRQELVAREKVSWVVAQRKPDRTAKPRGQRDSHSLECVVEPEESVSCAAGKDDAAMIRDGREAAVSQSKLIGRILWSAF